MENASAASEVQNYGRSHVMKGLRPYTTKFHNAHFLNDVDITVPNSQFKISNFQKSKGVFLVNIEIWLAKK